MTTFEHGKAPAWACATWYRDFTQPEWFGHITHDDNGTSRPVKASVEFCEILCRALSLAKLAEDWAADLDEAARAALLKACAE